MNRHRPPLATVLASMLALIVLGCSPAMHEAQSHDAAHAPARPIAPPPAQVASADPDLDRAKAAAKDFHQRLRGTLRDAMQESGPVAAVDVCNVEAPRIAEAVMAEHGVRLGRVALPGRNRNPAQVAADWKLATLEAFQQAVDGGAAAAEQVSIVRDALPDGVALRMMRGIATEPGCVLCHGKNVAEPIRDAIRARYPDDHATGFDVGDLRGALWVEVPAAGAAP